MRGPNKVDDYRKSSLFVPYRRFDLKIWSFGVSAKTENNRTRRNQRACCTSIPRDSSLSNSGRVIAGGVGMQNIASLFLKKIDGT